MKKSNVSSESSQDEPPNKRSKHEETASAEELGHSLDRDQVWWERFKRTIDKRIEGWFAPDNRELNLSWCELGGSDGAAIGKALETNTSLIAFYLSTNRLGDGGGVAIGKALEINASLTTLDLSDNELGDDAGAAIGKALETNTSLTTLYLAVNRLRGSGGAAICKALETNTSLTALDLSRNGLGDDGGVAIGKVLETNTSITTLDLSGEGCTLMSCSRRECDSLCVPCGVAVNGMGDYGAAAISKSLETNTSLTTLDLSVNRFRDSGAAICKALETNTSLTTLHLHNNFLLGGVTLDVVDRFLQRNNTLLAMRRLRTFLLGTLKPSSHQYTRKTSSPVLMLNQDVLGMIASYVIATSTEDIQ